MSFRHSGSKTFTASEFIGTECGIVWGCPEPCPVHEPYCTRAPAPYATGKFGIMKLIDPLNIKNIMPGTKQKLLTLSISSMIDNFWGWYTANAWARLVADGAEIFKRDIYHTGNAWRVNDFSLDKDISTANILDVQFREQTEGSLTGYVTLHTTLVKLDWEYYSEIAPVTADVKITVKDSKTGVLVKNAYVALMSGVQVLAEGYTDGGVVLFEGIDEGSYTIKIQAGGYNDFEQSIEVTPPSVWYTVKIVPIPTVPIPDWVWWAVGGVAALGAITIIPSVIRRKPEEKVIVVR